MLGWSAGLLLLGLAYGSIGDSVGDLVGDSETTRDVFGPGGDLVDGFYATSVLMLAVIAAGFAISSALRPRGEEEAGRLEPLTATALPRSRWLLAQMAVTSAGTVLVLLSAGVGLASGYFFATGDTAAYPRYGLPVLAQVAPVLTLSGLVWVVYGLAPRWAALGWLGVGWAAVVLLFGEVLRLPQPLQDLSPFEHLSLAPAEPFQPAPMLAVFAVAAALTAAAWWRFQERDIG